MLLGIFNKEKSRNVVDSSNVTLLVPGMLCAGVQDNDRAREEQQTAQSRHCSLDSADRGGASASTVTQLHSHTAKWTSADLLNCRGRPLQLNTETPSPAQPPPHQRGIFLSDFWIVLLGHKNNVRSRNIIFNYYSNGQRVEGEILY